MVAAAVAAGLAGALLLRTWTGGDDVKRGVPPAVLETGVEVFSLWRDWPVNELVLDRVVESGSGWVRVGVGWCSLE
ncbi:hypothetical protein ACI796_22675, partial [Geodermatophilus sp. SYSU D00525]